MKDGKGLYEAEKFKRESFGKLFSEFLLKRQLIWGVTSEHGVMLRLHTDPRRVRRFDLFTHFLSGKSFLRNRLFRGLDSWPPTSFCVSYNSTRPWPSLYSRVLYFSCILKGLFSCSFADTEAQKVWWRTSRHLTWWPAVLEILLSCRGAAFPHVSPNMADDNILWQACFCMICECTRLTSEQYCCVCCERKDCGASPCTNPSMRCRLFKLGSSFEFCPKCCPL